MAITRVNMVMYVCLLWMGKMTHSSAVELDCPPGIIPCHNYSKIQRWKQKISHPGLSCRFEYLQKKWVLPVRYRGMRHELFQAGACCGSRWRRQSELRTWRRCCATLYPWRSGPARQQGTCTLTAEVYKNTALKKMDPPIIMVEQAVHKMLI